MKQYEIVSRCMELEADRAGKLQEEHNALSEAEHRRESRRVRRIEGLDVAFEPLAEQNREIAQRAGRLISMSKAFYDLESVAEPVRSPWINLKRPQKSEVMHVGGYVSKRSGLYHDQVWDMFTIENYSFRVYFTDHPHVESSNDGFFISSEPTIRIDSQDTFTEETFDMSPQDPTRDTIRRKGAGVSSHSELNPLKARKRRLLMHEFQFQLARLSDTADLFEEATSDPELNPQLVPLFERTSSAA